MFPEQIISLGVKLADITTIGFGADDLGFFPEGDDTNDLGSCGVNTSVTSAAHHGRSTRPGTIAAIEDKVPNQFILASGSSKIY